MKKKLVGGWGNGSDGAYGDDDADDVDNDAANEYNDDNDDDADDVDNDAGNEYNDDNDDDNNRDIIGDE
jgi:hypothetical protein